MGLPNEVQAGRYNAILHKLLAMKEGSPSPQLTGEIVPTLQLEGDRSEWAFLAGEVLLTGFSITTAVAGELGKIQLENPAASGMLAVVERASVIRNAGGNVYLANGSAALAANFTIFKGVRDFRWTTVVRPGACLIRSNTAVASTMLNRFWRFQQTTVLGGDSPAADYHHDIVLAPGDNLLFEHDTANTAMTCGFVWRERPFEPSETR